MIQKLCPLCQYRLSLKGSLRKMVKTTLYAKQKKCHFDLNENWLRPVKPSPQQPSEAGHAHFLHAAKPHPGVASRKRCKASSFGNCHSILLPHALLTAVTHQSSCPITSLHLSFPSMLYVSLSSQLTPFYTLTLLRTFLLLFQKLTKSKSKHKKLRKGSKLSPHYLPKRCSWETKYAKWYGCSGWVTPWIKQ